MDLMNERLQSGKNEQETSVNVFMKQLWKEAM
jgi:hypothetical protein